MKLSKHHLLCLASVLVIYFFLNLSLIYTKPAIWPDEAVYFDIAHNFTTQGRLATDLWQGLVPGVEKMALWNPPVFFLILSFWLKFAGFTLLNQRLLSAIVGSFVLVLLYRLSFTLTKNKWSGLIATLITICDFHFMRATRISRPEIFVLLFTLASLNILASSFKKKYQNLQFFLSGLLFSVSILIHPLAILLAIFYAIYLYINKKLFVPTQLISFIFGLTSPIFLWLLNIQNYWPVLYTQINLASIKKLSETTWIQMVFSGTNPNLKILYASFITITLYLLYFTFKNKKHKNIFFTSILLSIVWFMALYGRMFWYYAYIGPAIAVSTSVVLTLIKPKNIFKVPIFITIYILLNTIYSFDDFSKIKSANPDYTKFTQEILSNIPDKTTVYLSATPDPYYGFFTAARQNKLIEFPVYPIDQDQYLKILGEADYIVTTGNQEELILGSLFPEYINLNTHTKLLVGKGTGYEATVIELKPIHQRIMPIIGNP